MPRTQTDARDKILATADRMFYRDGVRATGIDAIIAQSSVAKTTLYRYFPSKDDLVVAYLESRNQQFWQLLEEAVESYERDPMQQLVAIVDWLDGLLSCDDSEGCPFLIVASEFPEADYAGHQVAIAHKQRLQNRLADLAEAAGIEAARELSSALMLLIDGAFVQQRLYREHRTLLKPVAVRLIRAYSDP